MAENTTSITAEGAVDDTELSRSMQAEVDHHIDTASEAHGAAAAVNVSALNEILMGSWPDIRREAREFVKNPALHRRDGLSLDEQRQRVLDQLHLLVAHGSVHRAFPIQVGGLEDNGGNITAFEELVTADPSLQIKGGVQWGLFGSAIVQLGTERHHHLLPEIMDLTMPGAFAMTEIGHGSDVANIATTATYDEQTHEFVINTPFRAAWKEFLGNAGQHGKAATVFAQLITKGVSHGVHAFYVPIRDDKGFLPGIDGNDDGWKGGLNGIDNGTLAFDSVRVPRENLLNKYGDVAEDGTYSSPIDSPGRRFFTMLGTLVQGRVSLDGAATAAAALGLTIAIRYGNERRQFKTAGEGEQVLLDYQLHQRRLLMRLATTYAQTFAHDELLVKFDSVFSGEGDTDEDRQDLETLAAALKPLSTWHALDTLQEAREACGGAGFMAVNRLVGLRADLDVYVTFEGDNNVLLQLVAKRLLTDFSAKFKDADIGALASYVVSQAADAAFHGTGLRKATQVFHDFGSTARSIKELRETDVQRELLTDRVQTMVSEIAGRLRGAEKMSAQDAAELFNSQQRELIEAARAHGELLQWEAFTRAYESLEDEGTRRVIEWLHDVFGLGLIEKHLSWYLIHGRLSPQRALAITAYIDRLLARLRPHAQDLVDAFGYEQEHLRAPISSGIEGERQDEAREYYRALAASGNAPVEEKTLKARKKKKK